MKVWMICAAMLAASVTLPAQDAMSNMPGMQHPQMQGMSEDMHALMQQMQPKDFIQSVLRHTDSGTSSQPNSTPTQKYMLMTMKGEWMLMFHANAFVNDTQQSGTRGADKFFSTNWLMPMAQRRWGRQQLTLRAMLSLEPATVTGKQYPLLFQQGETANGVPIADGQHPHDFFMELAALYDVKLSEKTLLSFYVAPHGDPSMGPTAYPHRMSAFENPVGSLGHHQEDSTHIASDVVTMGVTHRAVRVEASGFHGREPDEKRWNIDSGQIDSWSTRITVQPGQNWSGQYSYARIVSPESLFPDENQERMTASAMYNRPFAHGNWASTVVWGRTRDLAESHKANSYLLESTLQFAEHNNVWTRMENAARTNELLNGEYPLPIGFHEEPLTHVQAYTFGYDRELSRAGHLSVAIGAQVTAYGVGKPLQAVYGEHPVGVNVFLRLRPLAK